MYFLYWYDYLLAPVYIALSIFILRAYFNTRRYKSKELNKYFNTGMYLKLFGCIAIGLIYEHYYRGSFDGRFYFEGAKMLSDYFYNHPSEIGRVFLQNMDEFNFWNRDGLNIYHARIFADSSFYVAKITSLFSLLSFNAFLPTSILFCTIAYLSVWNLYILMVREFNLTYKVAAFCSIYIPSILIWSSSIFKDTITFSALCWLFICSYYIFIKPRKLYANIFGLLIAAILIIAVKVYILGAFLPFFIFYVFSSYKEKIPIPALKSIVTPLVIAISVAAILVILRNMEGLLGNYSLENVVETASVTAGYIAEVNAGSSYKMNVDYSSFLGLITAFPLGVNVTLFRPYPWEYLKPFTLLASVESMAILYFTIKVFRRVKWRGFISGIVSDPTIQFCLFFSLIFAFMVGISAQNFGTLVRYKIPLLPFYTLFLALLYQRYFPDDAAVSRITDSSTDK